MVLTPMHQHILLPVTGPLINHLFSVPHDSEASTAGFCVVVVTVVAVEWGNAAINQGALWV